MGNNCTLCRSFPLKKIKINANHSFSTTTLPTTRPQCVICGAISSFQRLEANTPSAGGAWWQFQDSGTHLPQAQDWHWGDQRSPQVLHQPLPHTQLPHRQRRFGSGRVWPLLHPQLLYNSHPQLPHCQWWAGPDEANLSHICSFSTTNSDFAPLQSIFPTTSVASASLMVILLWYSPPFPPYL